jgi:hypothetical protein
MIKEEIKMSLIKGKKTLKEDKTQNMINYILFVFKRQFINIFIGLAQNLIFQKQTSLKQEHHNSTISHYMQRTGKPFFNPYSSDPYELCK